MDNEKNENSMKRLKKTGIGKKLKKASKFSGKHQPKQHFQRKDGDGQKEEKYFTARRAYIPDKFQVSDWKDPKNKPVFLQEESKQAYTFKNFPNASDEISNQDNENLKEQKESQNAEMPKEKPKIFFQNFPLYHPTCLDNPWKMLEKKYNVKAIENN